MTVTPTCGMLPLRGASSRRKSKILRRQLMTEDKTHPKRRQKVSAVTGPELQTLLRETYELLHEGVKLEPDDISDRHWLSELLEAKAWTVRRWVLGRNQPPTAVVRLLLALQRVHRLEKHRDKLKKQLKKLKEGVT